MPKTFRFTKKGGGEIHVNGDRVSGQGTEFRVLSEDNRVLAEFLKAEVVGWQEVHQQPTETQIADDAPGFEN